MGGLVGCIGPGRSEQTRIFEHALDSLKHHAVFLTKLFVGEKQFQIGAAFRERSQCEAFYMEDAGLTVLLYGTPVIKETNWRALSARDLANRIAKNRAGYIYDLDGSFIVVIIHHKAGVIEVVNDRIASIPLVYAQTENAFAFAPEAKAIFHLLKLTPRLDVTTAIGYVNCGYPAGFRTQFENINLLPPGSKITIDVQTAKAKKEFYWQVQFRPDKKLSEKEAVERLYSALIDGQKAALADSPKKVQLLLTGGLDSRTVLGISSRVGHVPNQALTWGIADSIPYSDPAIAKELASLFNVPFQLLPYDENRFAKEAAEWAYVSEVASENHGSYTLGAAYLIEQAGLADVVLIGDQVLGPSGIPLDFKDAVETITKVPREGLLPAFQKVLKNQASDPASKFWEEIKAVSSLVSSNDPKSLQDGLYFYLYAVRWLFSPSFFREPMVTVRRPMMSKSVIDLALSFPAPLRVDKHVLREMLESKMPELFRSPSATANSLIDWDYLSRTHPEIRAFLERHLSVEKIQATPLGQMIDPDEWKQMVKEFFQEKPAPVSRGPSNVSNVMAWRRKLSASPALGRLARRVEPGVKKLMGWSPGTRRNSVLWRIATLSLLQEQVDAGRFSS